MFGAAFTVRVSGSEALTPLASVTSTVKVFVLAELPTVPLITPPVAAEREPSGQRAATDRPGVGGRATGGGQSLGVASLAISGSSQSGRSLSGERH